MRVPVCWAWFKLLPMLPIFRETLVYRRSYRRLILSGNNSANYLTGILPARWFSIDSGCGACRHFSLTNRSAFVLYLVHVPHIIGTDMPHHTPVVQVIVLLALQTCEEFSQIQRAADGEPHR
jgi:hypothetical protein